MHFISISICFLKDSNPKESDEEAIDYFADEKEVNKIAKDEANKIEKKEETNKSIEENVIKSPKREGIKLTVRKSVSSNYYNTFKRSLTNDNLNESNKKPRKQEITNHVNRSPDSIDLANLRKENSELKEKIEYLIGMNKKLSRKINGLENDLKFCTCRISSSSKPDSETNNIVNLNNKKITNSVILNINAPKINIINSDFSVSHSNDLQLAIDKSDDSLKVLEEVEKIKEPVNICNNEMNISNDKGDDLDNSGNKIEDDDDDLICLGFAGDSKYDPVKFLGY